MYFPDLVDIYDTSIRTHVLWIEGLDLYDISSRPTKPFMMSYRLLWIDQFQLALIH